METDASQEGLIAVLSQEHDGKSRVIAYDSRRLRPTERNMDNYSLMKLEFLALKWAVTEKFCSNLLAAEFEVLTDNNPLSHLKTAKLGVVEQSWASHRPACPVQFQDHIQAWEEHRVVPKSYRSEGQPRSTRSEFPSRGVFGNCLLFQYGGLYLLIICKLAVVKLC